MLIHDFITRAAGEHPARPALGEKKDGPEDALDYVGLQAQISALAAGFRSLGLAPRERVAVWLPKQRETVLTIFAASAADGCFVPINPILKPAQVAYQLEHSDARVLVTSAQRLRGLTGVLDACSHLKHIVLIDELPNEPSAQVEDDARNLHLLADLLSISTTSIRCTSIDADMAAILYTSGSTGKPKGVVLSHRNMVTGAESVASYIGNSPEDRILSVLPLSFDAGLSQLTTAFCSGAYVHLMDYLLPRDVLRAVERHQITGITGVPSLWNPLSRQEWSPEAASCVRYLANTGGAMPEQTTRALAERLPDTELFLMYGLTEAFRSTFLPPAQALKKPLSVGQAIPNAQVMIVDEQGQECAPGVHGELVHRGALVAMGYWKNPGATQERFRAAPGLPAGIPTEEIAVWSGDTAYRDDEGDIFFVSRTDSMIKTSGYRVSPSEIEEEAIAVAGVEEVAAVAAPDPDIGQAIVLFVGSGAEPEELEKNLRKALSTTLPAFMLPKRIYVEQTLPLNPNGKVDRPGLAKRCADEFQKN